MERIIKILGTDQESIELIIDDDETNMITVTPSKGISAAALFDFLDFKEGNFYKVIKGEMGSINEGTFSAFYKLIEDIINEINEIAKGNLSPETDSIESPDK